MFASDNRFLKGEEGMSRALQILVVAGVAVFGVLMGPTAFAQDKETQEVVAGEGEEAEALYQQGIEAMKAQKWSRAARSFAAYQTNHPTGQWFKTAQEMEKLAHVLEREAIADKTNSGRVEYVVSLTTYGIFSGVALGLGLDLEENTVLTAAALGGAALGASLFDSGARQVSEGEAALTSAGVTWGAWHGIALLAEYDPEFEPGIMLLWGATTAGLITGQIIDSVASPKPGHTSFATTVGLWSGIFTGLGFGLLNDRFEDEDHFALWVLAGADAGLITGAWFAPEVDMSVGRSRLINLGGALGMLTGFGVILLAEPDDEKGGFLMLGLGAGAGLGIAAFSTKDWDKKRRNKRTALLDENVYFDTPTPFAMPYRNSEGKQETLMGVHLLRGAW